MGAEVRDNPTDAQRRAFLFELLCFAGQFDRAEKQLSVLGRGTKEAEMGALLYHAALHGERLRNEMFDKQSFPVSSVKTVGGTINGQPFSSITDADPRIGPRLEIFVGGQYSWMAFQHIATVRMEAPKRLRDLLWAPAVVRPNESFTGLDIGDALLPALAPQTWRESDPAIRLGRVTEWRELEDGDQAPVGQKMLLVDDEEFPILELRELVIEAAPTPST